MTPEATRVYPPGHNDEFSMLLSFLDFYRETMILKAEGLSEDEARFAPTPNANSLLNLLVHLAGVERRWTEEILLGRPHDRDRDSEFGDLSGVTLTEAVDDYRAACKVTNEAALSLELDAPCAGEAGYSNRWVLLHLLEETARHAGHADITRELIDGSVGD